jgi:hypothetical protein
VVNQVITVTVSSGVGVELAETVTGITVTGTPGVVSAAVVSVRVSVCSGTLGVTVWPALHSSPQVEVKVTVETV